MRIGSRVTDPAPSRILAATAADFEAVALQGSAPPDAWKEVVCTAGTGWYGLHWLSSASR